MRAQPAQQPSQFVSAFSGSFVSLLRWHQLDAFWDVMRSVADQQWYIYAVGEPPPIAPASSAEVQQFIGEIDTLLRAEHREDYCGIVYVDDREQPTFIKIYDPNNLGSSCGSSGGPPPLPGWILSLVPPEPLETALPMPGGRRRWWRRLLGN
ncbi:MAG: hypothetical protein JSW10_11695 [Pseudomonadota bacterium]|nr:MAG: hypothetical protein JSW10_11695 [Pseudomonadota bacterium]